MDAYLDIERGEYRDTVRITAIMADRFTSLEQGNCLSKSVAMLFRTIIFIVDKFASLVISLIDKIG